MNNQLIKELERVFRTEIGEITIGDAGATKQLKLSEREDASLENILIAVHNLIKVNQVQIKRLENNLDALAPRIYNASDDFSKTEQKEIEFALEGLELEQLEDINNFKDHLHDSLYCGMKKFDVMIKKQDELMGKIKYPTQRMHTTFNELVAKTIPIIARLNYAAIGK